MRKFLCWFGFHKWSTREIHQGGFFVGNHVTASVIDRCECGVARITIGGREKPTSWVIPTKYRRVNKDIFHIVLTDDEREQLYDELLRAIPITKENLKNFPLLFKLKSECQERLDD